MRDANLLSHFRTKHLLHAKLRNCPAWVLSEVSVMPYRTLKKHEHEVLTVVEQSLNAMILTKLTTAEIIDAVAVSAQQSQNDATKTKRPQINAHVCTRFN